MERNVDAKKGDSGEATLKLNIIVCFLLISGLLKIVATISCRVISEKVLEMQLDHAHGVIGVIF